MPGSVPRPVRPSTVTVAFYLQLAVVLLLLIAIIVTIAEAIYYDSAIDRVAARTGADPAEVADERNGNVFGVVTVGLPCLLLAGWLAACAFPLRRGRNLARILTFVGSGLQLLACLGPIGCGLLFVPLMLSLPAAPYDPETGEPLEPGFEYYGESEFLEQLYAETEPAMGLSFLVFPLLTTAVFALSVALVVLLLTSSSNRFFVPRPPVAPWPYPGHPYPLPGQVAVPAHAPPGYGYGWAPGYPLAGYGPGWVPPGYGWAPGYPPPGYGYGWPSPGYAVPGAAGPAGPTDATTGQPMEAPAGPTDAATGRLTGAESGPADDSADGPVGGAATGQPTEKADRPTDQP